MPQTKAQLQEENSALESRCAVFAQEINRLQTEKRERDASIAAKPYRAVTVMVEDAGGRRMTQQMFMMNKGDALNIHVNNDGDVRSVTERRD